MSLELPEVEELLLKRCWLSRYWALAARHGVYADIAHAKHKLWASLAPSPLEFVFTESGRNFSTGNASGAETDDLQETISASENHDGHHRC